jgi:hypothetical protein
LHWTQLSTEYLRERNSKKGRERKWDEREGEGKEERGIRMEGK